MTRSNFDNELEQLNTDLIKMGAVVEEAISNSIKAFKNLDYALAKKVIENDRVIDDMEKGIESRCLSLILRQQPVARDLRMVSSALKIVSDMERIGDHAGDISEIVLRLKEDSGYVTIEHISEMAELSKSMVYNAIHAFVNEDAQEAHNVIKNDDEIDALFSKVVNEIAEMLKNSHMEDKRVINTGIDFLMIAKYFEKIGDHAENICDWVEFNCTGEYKNLKML